MESNITAFNIEEHNNSIFNQNTINTEIIIDDEINNNIINNNILINTELSVNNENTNDRYLNILDALGLNINISYPMKMIVETIIELHVDTLHGKSNHSRHARVYKFKLDLYSNKIKENLGEVYGQYISYQQISRMLNRVYRNYFYNYQATNKNNKDDKNQIIGFNYENPCWNSYEISVI
jgi:hypothetical protein